MLDCLLPRYKVLRDSEACVECGVCERSCANGVHHADEKNGRLSADHAKCVNCQRCVVMCPTLALAVTAWPQVGNGSNNWTLGVMQDIAKQAQTGAVLLSSMGNPQHYPIYWDHLLLNASQVTNPSIDPLREPMETRVFLGSRPDKLVVNEREHAVVTRMPPQLKLDIPVMFSAMSFGSISLNAQKSLAMAAVELGTYFNTGEGGLHKDLERYGDHAIVQVASGRFGVDMHYLNAGSMIEIKIGQGAKPGIGGHLPGEKINEEVSQTRMIPQGTDAISPAPHHDIYSIEDLAQLIHDLKNVNTKASISVKLVSEVGVGTVAAGVAKAKADHVVIAGHDGGTGASPVSSIKHVGTPWELGLAETQQTLVLNRLRSRIRVQADGQMKTGRDVVIGALLGADEFGFATAPLVVEGCIMMRKCHLNTCPVGVATQDPVLRKKFQGKPEHVVNFFFFIAEEVREIMAQLGIRKFDDLIGRADLLDMRSGVEHWKAQGLDFARVFHQTQSDADVRQTEEQDHGLAGALDHQLIERSKPALERGEKVSFIVPVRNRNRTIGAMLSGAVAARYGHDGLPDDTIHIQCNGTAGQSFGAFLAHGITMDLVGEGNDYVGKGLSGGRIIVRSPNDFRGFGPDHIIAGNTVLYGALAGEAFFNGVAGERFAVRNSGAATVVEGTGDHGCEYMTGGTVVVLGATGRNFAAGMSGGVAYVWDPERTLKHRANLSMVELEAVVPHAEQQAQNNIDVWHSAQRGGERETDEAILRRLVEDHFRYTGSFRAREILGDWEASRGKFVKVMPTDYRRALGEMWRAANPQQLAA